ncbi:hypothetical protein [Kitasatospora cinereorecta]
MARAAVAALLAAGAVWQVRRRR